MKQLVLIVDDDELGLFINNLAVQDLTRCHPVCLNNAKQALELLYDRTKTEREVLLFLDLNMPQISGWDVLEFLTCTPPPFEVSVVVVTSSIDEQDWSRATGFACVKSFMVKPIHEGLVEELKLLNNLARFFK